MMSVLCSASGDYLNELALRVKQDYGISISKVIEIDDESFVADTGRRKILIEKIKDSETCLIYISGIHDYIRDRGFKCAANMYTAKSGKRYGRLKDGFYVVSDYIGGEKGSLCYQKNEKEIVKLLAAFHMAAEGYSPPPGGKPKADWGKWIEKYKKQYNALKKYKEQLINKDVKSPFEELFLKTSGPYLDRMERSIRTLKKEGYISLVEESMKRRQVCLGSFKQSNFHRGGSHIYIKSLDKCRYDIVEKDIADLLQKILEYSGGGSVQRFIDLVLLYNSRNNLKENSIAIISAFLIFPDEYEKVCSRYYKGKDKWTGEMYIEKLKNAIRLDDRNMELAAALERKSVI